jgi:hypothetical protein
VCTSHGIDKITCEQQGWEWPHLMGQVKLDYEKVRRMVASTSHGSGKVRVGGAQGREYPQLTGQERLRMGSKDLNVHTEHYVWVAGMEVSKPHRTSNLTSG